MAKGTAAAQTGNIPVRVTYSGNHDPKPGDTATTKAQVKAVVAKQSKGKGSGKGRGKGGGGGNPIARAAQYQVSAAEQPIEAQIKAERQANLQKAQSQMGFSKAAAAIMQAAAPAVQSGYSNAANADAGYARALGSQVQAPLDQNQQQSNAFLAKMGTPGGALHQAAPVGNMAYGLQGYIPASTLQREGAAWEAQAQLAPANLLHAGQQEAGATLANDPTMATLQNDLAKVAATQPAVYQKLLTSYQDQTYRQQSLNLRAQYENASIALRQANLKLTSAKDAKTLALKIQQGNNPDATLSKEYGYIVDSHGQPILNNRGQRIKVRASSSSSSGLPPWALAKPSKKGGMGATGAPLASFRGGPHSFQAGGFLPPGMGFEYDRHDQGRDIQTRPGAPIIAPGDGYVVRIASDPGGGGGHFGPSYPIVHFTSGPYAGHDVYIGHTVAALHAGQHFGAGSVLSHTQNSGPLNGGAPSGWAEIGFAPGGTPGVNGQPAPF